MIIQSKQNEFYFVLRLRIQNILIKIVILSKQNEFISQYFGLNTKNSYQLVIERKRNEFISNYGLGHKTFLHSLRTYGLIFLYR